jgi:archaellum biogenesis protein FlaJ (TadC family)
MWDKLKIVLLVPLFIGTGIFIMLASYLVIPMIIGAIVLFIIYAIVKDDSSVKRRDNYRNDTHWSDY